MQTSVDVGGQPPRSWPWSRWLAVGVVAVAVAAAVLVVRGLGAPEAEQPDLPDQLAAEVVAVLEAASPDEHADHGHHFEQSQVLCAAEVFGFDPPDATTLADVERVYALHKCAIAAGLAWPASVRAYGPLVVELTGPAPRVILPGEMELGEGAVHADRIRALIPEPYHQAALAPDFSDPALTDDLRQRLGTAG